MAGRAAVVLTDSSMNMVGRMDRNSIIHFILIDYECDIGPFKISPDGSTLLLREYRWTRLANMLYIESPVGVGFSYSDSKNYSHSDESSAQDNYDAMQYFFSIFPEYMNNKFYITGESYAGKYIHPW